MTRRPAGTEPTVFRAQVRKDLAELDPDLARRDCGRFYERNKLPAPATAADQAARYVSLAFASVRRPRCEAPARSEDLPTSLLEVLDFAPLVQEFYRKSSIEERIPTYTRAYQAEGDRLRKPTAKWCETFCLTCTRGLSRFRWNGSVTKARPQAKKKSATKPTQLANSCGASSWSPIYWERPELLTSELSVTTTMRCFRRDRPRFIRTATWLPAICNRSVVGEIQSRDRRATRTNQASPRGTGKKPARAVSPDAFHHGLKVTRGSGGCSLRRSRQTRKTFARSSANTRCRKRRRHAAGDLKAISSR